MSFRLAIRILAVVLFFQGMLRAQEKKLVTKTPDSMSSIFYSKENQKLVSFSFGYHQPIASGNNFIGESLSGKSGFDFRFQFYAYKQFLLGFASNVSFFEVENPELVGNYKKTTVNETLFFLGYEFFPVRNFRLGILASIFGNARFKNKYSSTPNETFQIDNSTLNSYGLYVKYALHTNVHFFIDYSYKIGKTDIDTPNQLNAFFEKGSYHNIGFGISITMGHSDLFATLFN